MRILFVSIFLLSSSNCLFGQEEIEVYFWDKVKNANPDTIYGLSLEKMKLTDLPAELERFTELRILRIGKNKLETLPQFLEGMLQLKELDAGKNQFESFPMTVIRLVSLERLILNRNQFSHLPESMERLINLRYLDLYDTPITSLPETFILLQSLEEVDFTGVRFSREFQDKWRERMPNVNWVFDPPCDCM